MSDTSLPSQTEVERTMSFLCSLDFANSTLTFYKALQFFLTYNVSLMVLVWTLLHSAQFRSHFVVDFRFSMSEGEYWWIFQIASHRRSVKRDFNNHNLCFHTWQKAIFLFCRSHLTRWVSHFGNPQYLLQLRHLFRNEVTETPTPKSDSTARSRKEKRIF